MKSKKILKHIVKACRIHIETTLVARTIEDLTTIEQETINADKNIIHFINTPDPKWAGNYAKILTELQIYLKNIIFYKQEPLLDEYRYWKDYIETIRLKGI